MNRYIPYDKLSKKEQRRRNSERRLTWGSVKPQTIIHKSRFDYDRNRQKVELRRYLSM